MSNESPAQKHLEDAEYHLAQALRERTTEESQAALWDAVYALLLAVKVLSEER